MLSLVIILGSIGLARAQNRCNITDYGATNDTTSVNTQAIQKAIDACNGQGGGMVVVPAGTFITGTIHLKSNINLHLQAGAVLKGSGNITDYEPYKAPNFPDSTHYGIIYSDRVKNVSITGSGAVDGHERAFFTWDKAKDIQWGGTSHTRQGKDFRKPRSGIGDGPVVPLERPRQMIIFSRSKNISIRNVQLRHSPFWTLHISASDGVTISGIQIHNSRLTPNSDGIDITSSQNVTISDCDIRAGDDAIAVAGYNQQYELPGFHGTTRSTKNITISNCNLQTSSSGIRIGGRDQNKIENVLVTNVNITDSNRGIGIFSRGPAVLKNIKFSHLNIQTRLFTGDWWGNGEPIHISAVRGIKDRSPGSIRNISFHDIYAKGENGILMYGSSNGHISGVTLENIQFTLTKGPLTDRAGGNIDLRGAADKDKAIFKSDIPLVYGRYVDRLQIRNARFQWGHLTQDYYTHGMVLNHFNDVELRNVSMGSSPSNSGMKTILLKKGKDFSSSLPSSEISGNNK